MNNFIRICLSLDFVTKEKLESLSNYFKKPMSEVVRMVVCQQYDYFSKFMKE